jgi:hypothetical protein
VESEASAAGWLHDDTVDDRLSGFLFNAMVNANDVALHMHEQRITQGRLQIGYSLRNQVDY